MNYSLYVFEKNRRNVISLLDGVSLDLANAVVHGYRNNMIWNAGHLLLAQQLLWYHFSSLELNIPGDLMEKFGQDTLPPVDGYSGEEFTSLKSLLLSTTNGSIADYHNGTFKSYNPYSSEFFKMTMNTIEEAIDFNNYHEGVHYGYMLSQLRSMQDK